MIFSTGFFPTGKTYYRHKIQGTRSTAQFLLYLILPHSIFSYLVAMNSTVNEITKSITGRPSLFECSIDELQQLTSQYPFFAPAKFLLAKKMKENNSFLFEEQIQKASIYFQNPIWLDHLLNDTGADQNYTEFKKEEQLLYHWQKWKYRLLMKKLLIKHKLEGR